MRTHAPGRKEWVWVWTGGQAGAGITWACTARWKAPRLKGSMEPLWFLVPSGKTQTLTCGGGHEHIRKVNSCHCCDKDTALTLVVCGHSLSSPQVPI